MSKCRTLYLPKNYHVQCNTVCHTFSFFSFLLSIYLSHANISSAIKLVKNVLHGLSSFIKYNCGEIIQLAENLKTVEQEDDINFVFFSSYKANSCTCQLINNLLDEMALFSLGDCCFSCTLDTLKSQLGSKSGLPIPELSGVHCICINGSSRYRKIMLWNNVHVPYQYIVHKGACTVVNWRNNKRRKKKNSNENLFL